MARDNSPLPFIIAFLALVAGAIAMAISPAFVRLAEVGPFASAFWRASFAIPFLFVWGLMEVKRSEQELSNLMRFDKAVLLAGFFFAGDLFFWHLSILNTTIANATLLSCLAPVWVLLLSGAFIGEPVGRNAYFGLALCLLGTAALIGSSLAIDPNRLIGDIYGLITSVFFGLYFLAVRVARRQHGAGALTFMNTVITATLLLGVTLIAGNEFWPATLAGVASLVALGVVSQTLGHGLLAVALGSLSAVFSSLVIFIEALAAAFFAWLIFDEILTPLQLLGGAFILFGIWVARPR